MNYYLSDLHFGHANAIKFDARPFADVDEMDRVMIEKWNGVVGDDDDVYIVGDFCYRSGRSACKAGATEAFGGTGRIDEMGWYGDNSGGMAHPVGCKTANAWGLHDMHGTVWEWCNDKFSEYPQADVTDPKGADKGELRVLRGGSWHSRSNSCRSAARNAMHPGFSSDRFGFRVCLDVGGGSKITRHNV